MKPYVFNLEQIKEILPTLDPIGDIEKGFMAYSRKQAVVPPVGELIFKDPPGEAHIKYGYIKEDEYFVIKVASGFYRNVDLGIPNTSGLMLVFLQKTGQLAAVLLDEGYLTNVRTAAAGATVAKYMAPKHITRIGIMGAGIQGRMQLEFTAPLVNCKKAMVWGRNQLECDAYKADMEAKGFEIETTTTESDIPANCNLITTATPSQKPLLLADQIKPGTHITAMGSDTPEKIELDPHILAKADIIVADSIRQCLSRGEIFQALNSGVLEKTDVIQELGYVITQEDLRRQSEDQITVADLTGVAVQDIQIAKSVLHALAPELEQEVKKMRG